MQSTTWHNWTVEHGQKFRVCKPNDSDNFQKSKNVGRKPNYAKRIRTSPDPDIVMDRLEVSEVSASTNNSSTQPIVITESSQIIKELASQPKVIAESSQVQYNKRIQDPRVSPMKDLYCSSINISLKISQNAKEEVVKVLSIKTK